jgi:hypothetical protein
MDFFILLRNLKKEQRPRVFDKLLGKMFQAQAVKLLKWETAWLILTKGRVINKDDEMRHVTYMQNRNMCRALVQKSERRRQRERHRN